MQTINTKTHRGLHYAYIIVGCCCLMMGVNTGLMMSCAGIFYQPVSQALGVSVGEFGIYMSLSFITSSLMLSVAGKMMERMSARLLLTLSSALSGICLCSMGLFNSVWEFYVAGCVQGVTLAFLMYMSFPTLINRWFRTRVGLMIGICSAASGIGGVIFNPIGGWLITNYGWRWAYGCFGLLVLVIITPALGILLRNYPSDKNLEPWGEKPAAGNTKTSVEGISYRDALHSSMFYVLLVFAFLIMAVSTLNLFIPKYVLTLGFDIEQSAYSASAIMLGVTMGKLVLGYVNDRSGKMGTLLTTMLGAAGLVMLIFCGHSQALILSGAYCFGWAYAGVTVQTAMLVREVMGNKDYARIFSNISIALAAGGAIASGVWGFLAEHTSYKLVFWVGVCALIGCAIMGVTASANSLKRKAEKA